VGFVGGRWFFGVFGVEGVGVVCWGGGGLCFVGNVFVVWGGVCCVGGGGGGLFLFVVLVYLLW